MNIQPHQARGTIRKIEGKWAIELESNEGMDENTPVMLVFWDDRHKGDRSEIEEIARVQQIELEVAAKALTAEGALSSVREAFFKRLNAQV